ncbi:hypothetical protein K4K55_001161 [Colletotrichum sp. SAR 10_96]|nr:hypothetical protein K4K55_001161 [Colletotrichum sp. SAR 10_96]
MEEQHAGDPLRDVDTTSDPASSTTLSSSELTLRFPRPQGNRHLASWISSSEPDIMNPSDATDDDHLAESSFEFINTDDDLESQDDRGTEVETEAESLSSFDYARPDDVHSLDGIERTDDTASHSDMDSDNEDDAAEDRSRASSIQYAEQSLMNPSSRVPTPPLERQSISSAPNTENITHNHVTHYFQEPNPLCSVSVIQVMAQSYLLNKGPLRILYQGDPSAKNDITDKLTSALAASPSPQEDVITGNTCDPSSKDLQVKTCTAAMETVYQGEQVYSITVDNNRTFHSEFASGGAVITPHWTVPHLAVFFVTENDDEAVRQARAVTWGFVQRHAIPHVFISSTELFEEQPTEDWSDKINQHGPHRCVEFSDRDITPVRLPIDLKSFKEIDARQMNRNLAYLTGLYKTVDERQTGACSELYAQSLKQLRRARQYVVSKSEDLDLWSVAQYSGLSVILITALLLGNWHLSGSSATVPAVSTSAVPTPVVSPTPVSVSTSTITINLTSTTTIRVPQAKTSQGSTAIAPFAELADFFADKFPESPKNYVCSADKHSRNEILVKIPSGTKTSWLAKDSIRIDVLKGERSVKTKFSSTDEGIIIEIPRKEAYGVVTVAVNTTRKPKVNETFFVDFGKSAFEECLGFGKSVAAGIYSAAQRGAEQAATLASLKNSVVEDLREVSARIGEDASKTANYLKASWNPAYLTESWQQVRESRQAQDTLDWVDIKHKHAQIQSWLLWLKITHQTDKHNTYLAKAKKYMSDKKAAAETASNERLEREKLEMRARRKRERLEARCQSGFSRWTQQCKQQI